MHSLKKKSVDLLPKWIEKICIVCIMAYVVIMILSNYYIYSEEMNSIVLRWVKYIILLILFAKILWFDVKDYSWKTRAILGFALAVMGVSAIMSNNRKLLQIAIVILSARGIEFKKLLRWFLISVIGICSLIVLLALFDIIPDKIYMRGNVARHCLGFSWCATPAIFGWSFSMAYLYYREKRIKWWEIIVLLIINVLLFILTNTRLELLCAIFGVLVAIVNKYDLLKKKKKMQKTIGFLALTLPLFFTILSFTLAYAYDGNNAIFSKINTFSSSRLELGSKAVSEYGISLFGHDIEWIGANDIADGKADNNDVNIVDNSYITLVLRYGLLVGFVILAGYYLLVRWGIERNDWLFLMLLCIVFIHSLVNPHLITLVHNAFILLFTQALIWWQTKNEKE